MFEDSEKGSAADPSSVDVKEAGLESQGIHVPRTGFFAKVCCLIYSKFMITLWSDMFYTF